MIPNQNPKVQAAFYNIAIGTASTVAGPTIDSKGADSISISVLSRGTGAASTNGLGILKLQHATADAATAFADITGMTFTSPITQGTATSDTALAAFMSTSLVGKRRYLRLIAQAHTSVTANQTVVAFAALENLAVAGTASGAVQTFVA